MRPWNPITQTRFGAPEGNCTEAALATLVGCALEDVPSLLAECGRDQENPTKSWLRVLDDWLQAFHGLHFLWVDLRSVHAAGQILSLFGDVPHLMAGPSPRGPFGHMVVAVSGQMVWDPHPSRDGLGGAPDAYYFLVGATIDGAEALWKPGRYRDEDGTVGQAGGVDPIANNITFMPDGARPPAVIGGGAPYPYRHMTAREALRRLTPVEG